MLIRIPTNSDQFIEVPTDVVTTDIPFLLWLDTPNKFNIDVYISENKLQCCSQG
jgi:hypothetical protein